MRSFRHRRALIVVTTGVLLLWMPSRPSANALTKAASPSDFNGDGYADLAIGEPFDHKERGAVHVLYGSEQGLSAEGDQLWSPASDGVDGRAFPGDTFGGELVSGDFDRDGYADLAIGRWNSDFAWRINVLYGSPRGLTSTRDQRWNIGTILGVTDPPPDRKASLAAGDLDGDGYWDLAIGGAFARNGPEVHRGRVAILFGGSDGLSSARSQVLSADMAGQPLDAPFAFVVAAGDVDGDARADLAVQLTDGFAVFYGTADGLGGADYWPPSDTRGSLLDLVIGDFDGNGFGDVASGYFYPGGSVEVLYGTVDGLTGDGRQRWTPASPGVKGEGPSFGRSLAAGDLDGDGHDELAIGAPEQKALNANDRLVRTGSVTVLYGSEAGLSSSGSQFWTQHSRGVPGRSEWLDSFGDSLAIADYGRSRRADLAIAAPGETLGGIDAAGTVTILYGWSGGLRAERAQLWSAETEGVRGTAEESDAFGYALTP